MSRLKETSALVNWRNSRLTLDGLCDGVDDGFRVGELVGLSVFMQLHHGPRDD